MRKSFLCRLNVRRRKPTILQVANNIQTIFQKASWCWMGGQFKHCNCDRQNKSILGEFFPPSSLCTSPALKYRDELSTLARSSSTNFSVGRSDKTPGRTSSQTASAKVSMQLWPTRSVCEGHKSEEHCSRGPSCYRKVWKLLKTEPITMLFVLSPSITLSEGPVHTQLQGIFQILVSSRDDSLGQLVQAMQWSLPPPSHKHLCPSMGDSPGLDQGAESVSLGLSAPSHWGPPLPESRCERILFHPSWKMWRIFREISCGHFSWKLKGENLRNVSPKFRCVFRTCQRKISPVFRSREFPS